MKYVKCFFGEKTRRGSYRITHDKIYEVYSQEDCKSHQFWIICDNGTIGRFHVSNLDNLKSHEFGFIDVTAEVRDNKINEILDEMG